MNKLLGRIARVPCRIPGYAGAVRRLRSGSVAIVMYHGVDRDPMEVPHWCHLEAAGFEEQVRFLSREYRVIELSEAIERIGRRAPLPERCAVVTFDDGLRDVSTTAYPILRRHGVPASVFLVTGLIGSRQPTWPDRTYQALSITSRASIAMAGETWPLTTGSERASACSALNARLKTLPDRERAERQDRLLDELGRPPDLPPDSPLAIMGWEEIEELSRSGLIAFGSHTHTHPILAQCDLDTQRAELEASRDILRERLGTADLFAYPNGGARDFTGETKRLLVDLGYRCGLATVPGLNQVGADLFELSRIGIGGGTTLSEFEWLMTGF
jgi:peptidoglycan/xylan/chitin deacetylase (PgdA/CDA1 family)